MPWTIQQRGGEYCVIKKTDGENEGCHATRAKAERHMAALYANEPGAKQKDTRQEGPMNDTATQFEQFVDWMKEKLGLNKEQPQDRFMVWKEGDRWRWLAIYSNRYRDRDNPPEILAEAAHKDFVAAVDAGDWDYPELWLWHTPGSKSGQADFLAYDDRGFSIAVGLFDKGREHVAQALAEDDDLGTSHGMPTEEIKRDAEDPTILTRYRSKEISPLPTEAAANELTGFVMLEDKMELSKEKREWLEGKLTPEDMAELDAAIDAKAKEAEGMEYKDGEEGTEQVDPVQEPDPEPEEEQETPDYVTRDEIAEALTEVTAQMSAITESVAEFGKSLTELKESEDERIAKAAELTPAASLLDIVTSSAIGKDGTLLDGRTKLAKAGPKETDPNITEDGPAGFVSGIFKDWRAELPEALA